MTTNKTSLHEALSAALGDKLVSVVEQLGETTAVVKAADMLEVLTRLRDAAEFRFEQMIDLCGMDYSTYGDGLWEGRRFAAVYHLLSVAN
ncbi:MAG TPA: NADH-quinone oxidoreductase subunit C, partial [Gallionella sp.]|nr:NADH-quinone oxidoreductase subunit C [Gallionella sp.]